MVLAAALCLLLVPFPAESLWSREAFNAGHTILFAVLAFVIFYQVKEKRHFSNVFMVYFVTFLLGMLFGALVELLQSFVHREASLNDYYRDGFGLIAGLCLVAVYDLKEIRYRKPAVVLLMMTSAGFILLGMSSLVQLSWHYLERRDAFPVLMDFDSGWSTSFVRDNRGRYTGINIIELEPDWAGYHSLRMDVFSAGEETILLTLRVHDDKHNQDFTDRFNVKLWIRPGLNQIKIPLDDIANGPVHRQLDLENIAGIGLFTLKKDEYDKLDIGRISLE